MKNYEEYQLKDANDLTLKDIQSRLLCMDIDFDPNIKSKSYFAELYNSAVKNADNRKKISNKLLEDAIKIEGSQGSRVRSKESRDSLDFRFLNNDAKLSKITKKDDISESNNHLLNMNRDFADTAQNMINRSRKNLNFINEDRGSSTNVLPKRIESERGSSTNVVPRQNESIKGSTTNVVSKQNESVKGSSANVIPKQNYEDFLNNENPAGEQKVKRVMLSIPKLIKDPNYIKGGNQVINVVKFSLHPRTSHLILCNKVQPYKHAYVRVTLIMLCTVACIVIVYVYTHPDLLKSLKELSGHFPRVDGKNFNRVCFGLCLLPIIIYALNSIYTNEKVAEEVYENVKVVLEEIKTDDAENFLTETKLTQDFASKYDMHYSTFEQEILPRVKSLAHHDKKIKIFQFNDQDIWKLK